MNIDNTKNELIDFLNEIKKEADALTQIVNNISCDEGETPIDPDPVRPTIISPTENQEFVSSTNVVKVKWTGPIGAKYDIRCNDKTDPNARLPGNNCGVDKHYLCRQQVSQTEWNIPVKPGHEYRFWIHLYPRAEWSEVRFKVLKEGQNTDVKGKVYGGKMTGVSYPNPLFVSITFNNSDAVIYQISNSSNDNKQNIIPRYYPNNKSPYEWPEGKEHFQYKSSGTNGKIEVFLGSKINQSIKRVSLRRGYLENEFEQLRYMRENNFEDPNDPEPIQPGIQIGLKGHPLFMEAQGSYNYGLKNVWFATTISKISKRGEAEVAQLHPWYQPLDWDNPDAARSFIKAGPGHWKKVLVDDFVRDCKRYGVQAAGNDWESIFCMRELLPTLELQSNELRRAGIAVIHTPKRGMQHSLSPYQRKPQFGSKNEAYAWLKKYCDGIIWWDPSATIEQYKRDYCEGIANWCLAYDLKGVSESEDRKIIRDETGGIFNPKTGRPSVEYAKRVW